MSLFSALDISGSGIAAMQTWLNVDAGNIANADDVSSPSDPTYSPETPVFSEVGGSSSASGNGVAVNVELSSDTGTLEASPGNPVANADGEVRVPDVQLSDQLVGLMEAQEGYQGDADAITRAMSAYQAGLTIGS